MGANPKTPLVDRRHLLLLNLDRGQGREDVGHAVRLHPQRKGKLIRRNEAVVGGPRRVSRGVAQRSGAPHLRGVFAVVEIPRAPEHQVLCEVREASGPAVVRRAHVVGEVRGHEREAVVFDEDDLQAVVELVVRVGEELAGLGAGWGEGEENDRDPRGCSSKHGQVIATAAPFAKREDAPRGSAR